MDLQEEEEEKVAIQDMDNIPLMDEDFPYYWDINVNITSATKLKRLVSLNHKININ